MITLTFLLVYFVALPGAGLGSKETRFFVDLALLGDGELQLNSLATRFLPHPTPPHPPRPALSRRKVWMLCRLLENKSTDFILLIVQYTTSKCAQSKHIPVHFFHCCQTKFRHFEVRFDDNPTPPLPTLKGTYASKTELT